MSAAPIPVTVVLGWSAAAKADVARWLSEHTPSGVAVVCSEPMDAPCATHVVEGPERVAERSLGCACCTVRLDVRTAVSRLIARHRPPGRVLVVGSAEADPGPLLATLLCEVHLIRRTNLEAVVAVVDGREGAVRIATGQPLAPTGRGEEHLAVADRVVVTGANRLTEQARADLGGAIARVNPYSPWSMADGGWPELALGDEGAYALDQVAARLDALATPAAPTARSVFIDLPGAADPGGLRDWARAVFRDHGHRLLRLQAVCSVGGRAERWACSAVRSFYATAWCGPGPQGPPRARVLAIGDDLDREALAGPLRLALAAGA